MQFLISGFRNGFNLRYNGPTNGRDTSRNIPFTIGNKLEMWNKIMKEVLHNRYTGPFDVIPYESFIQSPIGLVPKAQDQTRLIFHLSYEFPNGNHSVNCYMLKCEC